MQNVCALRAHLLNILNDNLRFAEVIGDEWEVSNLLQELIGFPNHCVVVLRHVSLELLWDSRLKQCVLVALLDRDRLENVNDQIVPGFLLGIQQPAVVG